MAFYLGELIFIMKLNQVIKWDFLQELRKVWFINISANIKLNIKKDFHQKLKLNKDGMNMKNSKNNYLSKKKKKKKIPQKKVKYKILILVNKVLWKNKKLKIK
jgi:hypothetical protein